ncbi:MAG: metallophosphoesterase [Spirochaetaceae bacterium]|jgi:hypothetical protein|nr:metallophosphoesterase [Spirochaetaceae bacterium]
MNIAIGDLHGESYWRDMLKIPADNYYITGDYFDSFRLSFAKQKNNFIDLIDEAKRNERLHLCIGNHDLHYLISDWQQYSGFQYKYAAFIKEMVEGALPYLKAAYQSDSGYVISHAGFTKTFMRETACTSIADVEQQFRANLLFLGFNDRCPDSYGDNIEQGPLWVRPESLMADYYFPKQIVGHTEFRGGIQRVEEDGTDFVFVDCTNQGFQWFEF